MRAALQAALAANLANLWLFVPVLLGSGIWLWFVLPSAPLRLSAVLGGLAIAVGGLALSGMGRRAIMAAGLLLAAGILVAEWRAASVAPPLLHHRLTAWPIEGTIVAREPRDGGAATRLVIERPANGTDSAHRVRILVPGHLSPEFRPGAAVRVPATLGPLPGPVLPYAHDPRRAGWFEGVSGIGRATGPPVLLKRAARPGALAWLDGVRLDIEMHLKQHLPGDHAGLAVALVVGEQGSISPALVDAFRISGLAHLLTVSGFHVSILVAGTYLLARKLMALWPWLVLRAPARAIAALMDGSAGTFYALLSGAEVPAVRAAIMAWVVMLALAAGRNPLSLRLLAFAATLILLARPEVLLSPSFQLSFAAVTGLVLLANSAFGQRVLRPGEDDAPGTRLGRHALALLASGLVAELLLSPIALAHFGRAGLYGVIANLLAIPLTSLLIMPLLGLFGLASLVGLAGVAAVPLGWALGLLAAIAGSVAAWPGATFAVPAIPPVAYALGVAGAILSGLLTGHARWLGGPLLAAGLVLAVAGSRPDLLVSSDGRQAALAGPDGLHALVPHRRGFQWRAWEQAAGRPGGGLIASLPRARCAADHCRLRHGRLDLLLVTDRQPASGRFGAACANADIVVASAALGSGCQPRRMLLDAPALAAMGTVAIEGDSGRIVSSADVAGDHPWSPATLPGTRRDLLGRTIWTGVIAE